MRRKLRVSVPGPVGRLNDPSSPVCVPSSVPLMMTATEGSPWPVSASVTLPLITRVAGP